MYGNRWTLVPQEASDGPWLGLYWVVCGRHDTSNNIWPAATKDWVRASPCLVKAPLTGLLWARFPWTMRIFGFILLVTLGFANLVLKRRLPPANVTGGLTNFRQFKNPAYSLFTGAGFICFLGLYTGKHWFLCLPCRTATDTNLVLSYINASAPSQGVSANLAPYLVAIANTGSAVGRLITGMLGDRYGQ
jgi:hypothetical protein